MGCTTLRRLLAVSLAALIVSLSARAADDIKVPAGADGLIVLHLKALLASQLAKDNDLQDKVKALIEKQADVKKVMEDLNFDPLKDLDSLALTWQGNPAAGGKTLVTVNGKFDVKKISTALDNAKDIKVHKVAGVTVYEKSGQKDQPGYMAFAGASQLLISNDKDFVADCASGKGLGKPSKALATALDRLTGKETLSVSGVVTDELQKLLAGLPQGKVFAAVSAVAGGVTVTDAVDVRLLAQCNDPDAADEIKATLNAGKAFLALAVAKQKEVPPAAKKLINDIQIDADKTTTTLSFKVPGELVKEVLKYVK